jgi:hypothetical protein
MRWAVDPQAMPTALERDLENGPPKDEKDASTTLPRIEWESTSS